MGSLGLSREQRNMVVVLIVGAVLVVLNQTLLSPALPSIMSHLNVDATTVQWLTSAYALTEAVVIPLAAWFMGRFSTRKLFVGCMSFFCVGTLIAAVAPFFAILLFGRIMQAIATGVVMVMVMALIMLSFPREKRGQAMGIFALVINFAPAVGPSVGGLLVDIVGWRALFVVVVCAALIVILLALKMLVNREGFPRTKIDVLSVVFSSLGLALLLYGLSSFASTPNTAMCIALMAVGLVFVALFVRRQFRIEEPMLRLEVLHSRRYRVSFIAFAILQGTLIGLGVLMPLYIQNVLGCSATISGIAILPGALIGAVAGLISGRIFDRSGVRKIGIVGSIVFLLGCIGMFMYGVSTPLAWVILSYGVTSLGIQILATPINTWGVNSLDNELVQHATAVTNTINQVGGSLGTALIMSFSALGASMATQAGELEQLAYGYHWSYGVVLAIAAIELLIVFAFARNKKGDPVPNTAVSIDGPGKGSRILVADIMNTDPMTINASESMSVAVHKMASTNMSGLVVIDDQGSVKGFLSNSDVLRFFGDEMRTITGLSGFTAIRMLDDESLKDRVSRLSSIDSVEVATKQVVGIAPDATFEEACRVLAERRLKSLPVIEDGKLKGVVRRSDLMSFIAELLDQA